VTEGRGEWWIAGDGVHRPRLRSRREAGHQGSLYAFDLQRILAEQDRGQIVVSDQGGLVGQFTLSPRGATAIVSRRPMSRSTAAAS